MRRRDRYAGMVWLNLLPGEITPHRAGCQAVSKEGIGSNISVLTHDFHALVEMEQDHDAVRLRVFPMRPRNHTQTLFCALSYSGTDLANILATAVEDALTLRAHGQAATFSPTEVVRWVAS